MGANCAAELLMPSYLIDPAARAPGRTASGLARELADRFHVSRTATGIGAVEQAHIRAVLTCHGPRGENGSQGHRTCQRSGGPASRSDSQSYAIDILFSGKSDDAYPHKIGADAWFERW